MYNEHNIHEHPIVKYLQQRKKIYIMNLAEGTSESLETLRRWQGNIEAYEDSVQECKKIILSFLKEDGEDK